MRGLTLILSLLALCVAATAGDLYGVCAGVQDGSTLTVRVAGTDHTVKLFGIQAPEINQDYGLEAKQQAEALALARRVKVLDKGQGAGVVIVESRADLGSELLRAGCAWAEPGCGLSDLAKLEAEARAVKAGLWAAPLQVSPWDFRKRMAKLQAAARAQAAAPECPEDEPGNIHILGKDGDQDSAMSQSVAAERRRVAGLEDERIRRSNAPAVYQGYPQYIDPWDDDPRVTSRAGDSIVDVEFRGIRQRWYSWLGCDSGVRHYISPGALMSECGVYAANRNYYRLKNQLDTMRASSSAAPRQSLTAVSPAARAKTAR
jgi:endonuclease YncB( thermonuclease family)